MEKIRNIFEEAQRSAVTHKNGVKKLVTILESCHNDSNQLVEYLNTILLFCTDSVLIVSKKEPTVERVMKFLCELFTSVNEEIFTCCVQHLLQRSMASDKTVRFRSCQLLSCVLSSMHSDAEISDELYESMITILLPRLRDKNTTVRLWALKALSRLQTPEVEDDKVVLEIQRVMISDSSPLSRAVAVECISITSKTLPHIIDRVKDVNQEVRLAALQHLHKDVNVRHLSQPMRDVIIKHGLNDRDDAVKNASWDLVMKWVSQLENKVPKLLHLLNLQVNEEVIENLGFTLMEQLEVKKTQYPDLFQSSREMHPNWSGSYLSLNASELLWVKIRCDYAQKKLNASQCATMLDTLLPELPVICDLLQDCQVSTLESSRQQQLSLKYLLSLIKFHTATDSVIHENLSKLTINFLSKMSYPETLVDGLLDAWSTTLNTSIPYEVITKVLVISETVKSNGANAYPESSQESYNPQYQTCLSTIRYLQVVAWALQYQVRKSSGVSLSIDQFTSLGFKNIVSIVLESLQQPIVELRGLAVKCLGLIGMTSDILCNENKGILLQVASNELEDDDIRAYALRAIVDYAMVYPSIFHNDMNLTNTLVRIQELDKEQSYISCIASESTTKLLFGGILYDTRLMTILLKVFFVPEMYSDIQLDESDEELQELKTKLQQILSFFFQTSFIKDSMKIELVLNAISDLISDISMAIRNESIPIMIMEKVTKTILSLCDSIDENSIITKQFQMKFVACLSREILKLGNNKKEKVYMKEFIHLLSSISPLQWINSIIIKDIQQMNNVLFTCISKSDKTSLKLFDKFQLLCKEYDNQSNNEDITKDSFSFYSLAPGLADLVQMSSQYDHNNDTILEDDDIEEDFDESFSNISINPTNNSRPIRSSKIEASNKISNLINDENVNNKNIV